MEVKPGVPKSKRLSAPSCALTHSSRTPYSYPRHIEHGFGTFFSLEHISFSFLPF